MRSSDENRTSLSLLVGLRARDVTAWDRLVHLYGPLVFSWCSRRGLQPADAEDITQEVFRTVFARIQDFTKGEEGTFRGWLLGITRNKLGDFWRLREKQPIAAGGASSGAEFDQMSYPEADDDSPETTALFRRAFDLIRSEFEDITWQAFLQVVCENRKPADVAADLKLSLNAVYLAKSRVLRRLRETLGDLPGHDDHSQ